MIANDILKYLESQKIEYSMSGDKNMPIMTYCSLDNLKDDSITWVRFIEDVIPERFEKRNNILLFAELGCEKEFNFDVLYVENVHATFFQTLEHFFRNDNPCAMEPAIESSAVVLTDNIGDNVYIGHNTFVGKDVEIGDNTKIFNNVTIQGKVIIGNNCVIDSNTTIGANGYGHYEDKEGKRKTAPHLGGVKIGNGVEIGANSCIARGCLDDTIIEDGVMMDSMSFIGHNVTVKKKAMIIAGTCIGGSTTIGEDSWLGINSTISDQIVVGENTYVGMGTLVNKEMPPNKVLVGVPCRVLRDNTNVSKIKRKNRE